MLPTSKQPLMKSQKIGPCLVYTTPLDNTRETLLFLHYFGGSAHTWRYVVEALAPDFNCVALDQRGFGSADAPGDYTLESYNDDLTQVVETLALERYTLVGHSMGGKLALFHAMHQPKRLQSLILLSPSPPTPEPMPEDEKKRMLETHPTRAGAKTSIEGAVGNPLGALDYELTMLDNIRVQEKAWRAWLEVGMQRDISDRLNAVQVPVSIVHGTADEVIPYKVLEDDLRAPLDAPPIQRIKGAGHLLPIEAPERTVAAIRQSMAADDSAT